MPAKARVGIDTVGGGLIIGPGCTTVMVEGAPASIIGDAVAPHEPFEGEHLTATLVEGSATVYAEGRPVVRLGDAASCGHFVETGALTVEVGS
jgi:uncharacterized Zn-binding protein involved in type VI secretion